MQCTPNPAPSPKPPLQLALAAGPSPPPLLLTISCCGCAALYPNVIQEPLHPNLSPSPPMVMHESSNQPTAHTMHQTVHPMESKVGWSLERKDWLQWHPSPLPIAQQNHVPLPPKHWAQFPPQSQQTWAKGQRCLVFVKFQHPERATWVLVLVRSLI